MSAGLTNAVDDCTAADFHGDGGWDEVPADYVGEDGNLDMSAGLTIVPQAGQVLDTYGTDDYTSETVVIDVTVTKHLLIITTATLIYDVQTGRSNGVCNITDTSLWGDGTEPSTRAGSFTATGLRRLIDLTQGLDW